MLTLEVLKVILGGNAVVFQWDEQSFDQKIAEIEDATRLFPVGAIVKRRGISSRSRGEYAVETAVT